MRKEIYAMPPLKNNGVSGKAVPRLYLRKIHKARARGGGHGGEVMHKEKTVKKVKTSNNAMKNLVVKKPVAKKSAKLGKDARIDKERRRLTTIFTKIEQNTKKVTVELIKNAAFLAIILQDLQESIKKTGTMTKYRNSATQYGQRINPDVQAYNLMIKNYTATIKQLTDFLPKDEVNNVKKDTAVENFINSRD